MKTEHPLHIGRKKRYELMRQSYSFIERYFELSEQDKLRQKVPKSYEELKNALPDFRSEGLAFEKILENLRPMLFEQALHLESPRFFAYVPSPHNLIGALAHMIIGATNPFAGSWFEGAGPALIERTTIEWMLDVFGFNSQEAGGLFVSGGSVGNLLGLVMARDQAAGRRTEKMRFYMTAQTHHSVLKGAKIIGLPDSSANIIPIDGNGQMIVSELKKAISADRSEGLLPFAIVANIGTTNSGAVDDLKSLAEIKSSENLWLHGDAAYGGAAAFGRKASDSVEGIQECDSLCFDPHKWLFQPYECSVFLVRERRLLKQVFAAKADYLPEFDRDEEDYNYADFGLQLTRDFKALKVWLTVQYWGTEAIAEAVDRAILSAEYLAQLIRKSSSFEVVTPPQLGILTFSVKHVNKEDDCARLAEVIQQRGNFMVSTTIIGRRRVLRVCLINPGITEKLLDEFCLECENALTSLQVP